MDSFPQENPAGLFQENLFLGPVHFAMESERPLYPFQDSAELYEPFYQATPGCPIRHTCQVFIGEGDPLEVPAGAHLLFDSQPAWRLYEAPDGHRLLERYSGAHGHEMRPLWQAWLDPELEKVEVRVSGQLLRSGEQGFGIANPLCYPLDQLLMLHLLPKVETILIHGACVDFGAGAEVYAGVSGAGKTTFTRLITAGAPVACDIISDDRVLLVRTDAGWIAGGTPWPGEGRNVMSTWRPLRALHFLRQGDHEAFVPLSPGAAMEAMLPMVSVPWFDVDRMTAMLDLCGDLAEQHPCSDFLFRRDPAAGIAARVEGLKVLNRASEPSHVEGGVPCTR